MTIEIANAPCSWGVDYAEDINNPNWKNVLEKFRSLDIGIVKLALWFFAK